eukprot:1969759-Amphidinium_carterae.1
MGAVRSPLALQWILLALASGGIYGKLTVIAAVIERVNVSRVRASIALQQIQSSILGKAFCSLRLDGDASFRADDGAF